jgi:hypothetical protein
MDFNAPKHYKWNTVAHNHKTARQWLKRHRRLKKGAKPVGTITLIFDQPRVRPKYIEAISPEECQQRRARLQSTQPPGWSDLYHFDRAGQLAVCHLYDRKDTEPITSFREKEAQQLLECLIWDHSHEDDFITEKTIEGERQRRTWKAEISKPNLTAHLAGERYFGVKKGEKTMQVTVDCDRHSGTVSGKEHIAKVLKVGEVLKNQYPQYRFAPEITDKNGSVKFFGWLPQWTAMPLAEQFGEHLREVLCQNLPEYDFSKIEIFPSNSPQIFAPLRADKTMIIGDGAVKKVKRYRMVKEHRKRRRQYYEAYSCADYLNWVCFSNQPYNSEAFEKHLREAVAGFSGYRHGNFYICGLEVVFEHEAEARQVFASTTPPTRIYSHLSLYVEPDVFSIDDWLDLVMESRRLACDERFQERLWQRKGVFRMAA